MSQSPSNHRGSLASTASFKLAALILQFYFANSLVLLKQISQTTVFRVIIVFKFIELWSYLFYFPPSTWFRFTLLFFSMFLRRRIVFSSFLICECNTIHVPLNNTCDVSYKFWYILFSFILSSIYLKILIKFIGVTLVNKITWD